MKTSKVYLEKKLINYICWNLYNLYPKRESMRGQESNATWRQRKIKVHDAIRKIVLIKPLPVLISVYSLFFWQITKAIYTDVAGEEGRQVAMGTQGHLLGDQQHKLGELDECTDQLGSAVAQAIILCPAAVRFSMLFCLSLTSLLEKFLNAKAAMQTTPLLPFFTSQMGTTGQQKNLPSSPIKHKKGDGSWASFEQFFELFKQVFDHNPEGVEVWVQLLKDQQGKIRVAEYALGFCTLTVGSSWNKAPLKADFAMVLELSFSQSWHVGMIRFVSISSCRTDRLCTKPPACPTPQRLLNLCKCNVASWAFPKASGVKSGCAPTVVKTGM